MLQCVFKCHRPTRWGENVFVIGSTDELGKWEPKDAIPLHYEKDGWWKSDVTQIFLSENDHEAFSYKYLIKNEELRNETTWENGTNRVVLTDSVDQAISVSKKGKPLVYLIDDFNKREHSQIVIPRENSVFSKVKVLSFNIRADREKDRRNGRGWDERKNSIFEAIRITKPPVIALQEVLHHQLHDLLEEFPEYGSIGVASKDGVSKGCLNPILFRKGEFKVLEQGTFWLSEKPESPGSMSWKADQPCTCSWAKFQMRKTIHPETSLFSVYNTQLDKVSGKSRSNGLRLIMSRIRNAKTPSLLCGDLNELESGSLIQQIRTIPVSFPAVMFNAKQIARQRQGPEATYTGFSGKKNLTIDYVLVTTGVEIEFFEVLEEDPSCPLLPSSHRPISVEVDFHNCYQWKLSAGH